MRESATINNLSDNQLSLFLYAAMGVCALMAVIVLFRVRSRGISAYFLAAGFLTLGITLYGVIQRWGSSYIAISGFGVAALLVADFIARSVRGGQKQ